MAFSKKEKLSNDLGKILKQRRVMIPLTLRELATTSGVSSSHLGRIERGDHSGAVLAQRKAPRYDHHWGASYFTITDALGLKTRRFSGSGITNSLSQIIN